MAHILKEIFAERHGSHQQVQARAGVVAMILAGERWVFRLSGAVGFPQGCQ